jgi:hypothetical protein
MSLQLAIAEMIRLRLLTAPTATELPTPLSLAGLDIIVDRQKNILSDVTKAVAKAKGTAVVILWEGFQTVDKNSARPRLAHSYNISVWSKPVLAGVNLAADDVMESIIARLWHWKPTGGHAFSEADVRNGGLVPDSKFLKYDCEVVIPVSH